MTIDNQAILAGALAMGFFTLWLTISTSSGPPPRGRHSKQRSIMVFKDILSAYDPEPVGVWVAIGSALWGFFVGSDFGDTTAFPYGFPDNAAGMVIGIVGSMMLLAIACDLHRTYSFAALSLAFAWGAVGWAGFVTSGGHSAAWIVYWGAAVIAGWLWLRVWKDDRQLITSLGVAVGENSERSNAS